MSDRLTTSDPHHWQPAPQVWAWLMDQIPSGDRVLDVGAGYLPFPRADVLVDFVAPSRALPNQEIVRCDLGREPLPFPDKSFDFVYCRQTIEDMADPFLVLREMERVGRAGYIETPSPVAELCRGVDGGAPPWRGYNHHRWIVWESGGTLCLVSKYPMVEYLDVDMLGLASRLRSGPRYWATYHLWLDRITCKHMQNPLDFTMPDQYPGLLDRACRDSVTAADKFWRDIERAQAAA